MKKLFSVIFMNFWGYDLIIFIAAVLTGVIYYKLRESADKLYNKMHLTVFVPDGGASGKEAENDISVIRETDIVTMRNHTGKLYSMFVNMTGIFPLLGILGTVVSLLGLVADDTDVTGNFYGALTSTFWGLIFAIIFKFMDGIISAKIEDNEKTVALYLDRNNSRDRNTAVSAVQKTSPVEVLTPVQSDSPQTDMQETVSEIIINDRDSVAEILKALSHGDKQ
ncbi:MotA/TolQ/ExbB proton channel family protein [uncultured Ruminococcus sp.]|uniref:MotA/TolQ/ExbB proton channel family protein n=1 Tax=uncultured Ruminococcus sp. TaxID=165186 RepID=UPI00262EBA50|nr:MotA/TolQ/ExbB proton channel family protein [uncultured Ruminococcus sp.]